MKLVMKVPYVIKRRNTYYFKFNIPADCRHCQDGRTEIQKSLKTDDIFVAKDKAEKLAQIWKDKIAKIREANESADAPVQVAEIKLDAIAARFKKKIAPYIEKQIHVCLAMPDTELRKTLHISIENSIDAYKKCIAARTYTDQELINLTNPFAKSDQFALHTCTEFEPRGLLEDDVLVSVARRILPIILDGLYTVKAAIEKELYPERAEQPVSQTTVEIETGMSISEVLKEMLESTFRAEKTALGIKANVQLLIEWRGDIPIRTLSRADLIDFRDNCLRILPANVTKMKTYEGMSVKDVLETYKGKHYISARTVNNKINSTVQLMLYALENGHIDFAPVKKLKIPEEKKKGGKEFSDDELKQMVGLLEENPKYPSRYWVPLLGLYTGARLNELCQLHTDDVYQLDGVWLIDINDNDAPKTHKHLKNASSERLVPVHPELIRRGFIHFVQKRQQEAEPLTAI
ncbi:hypothetical protein P4B35_22680 [Pontiellaceae bacterium B12227]|nr:hypothetical protein [Pontiellaceae bacterium B12227]